MGALHQHEAGGGEIKGRGFVRIGSGLLPEKDSNEVISSARVDNNANSEAGVFGT